MGRLVPEPCDRGAWLCAELKTTYFCDNFLMDISLYREAPTGILFSRDPWSHKWAQSRFFNRFCCTRPCDKNITRTIVCWTSLSTTGRICQCSILLYRYSLLGQVLCWASPAHWTPALSHDFPWDWRRGPKPRYGCSVAWPHASHIAGKRKKSWWLSNYALKFL